MNIVKLILWYLATLSLLFPQDIIVIRRAPVATGGEAACNASVSVQRTNGIAQSTGTNLSVSMSVTTGGANVALFVALLYDGDGATITSVTYGGTAMTSAGTPAYDSTNKLYAAWYYLINPTAGSNTLAVSGTNVAEYYYGGFVFENVHATTPVRSGTYSTGNVKTMAITSNSSDWSITALEASDSTTSSDQVESRTSSGTYSAGFDRATTPASSVTHTWTAAGTYAMAGLSVRCR